MSPDAKFLATLDGDPGELVKVVLRSSQNWMRWYIQMYIPSLPTRQPLDKSLDAWKTRSMLELYVALLHIPKYTQYASQLLFYTTFPVSQHQECLSDLYRYLVNDCRLAQVLLQTLLHHEDIRTLLSLVRNIHNALATYAEQSTNSFQATKADTTVIQSPATNEARSVSLETALGELGLYSLSSASDLRFELTVEVLRCGFCLRIGKSLLHPPWRELMLQVWACEDSECQFAAVALLIDAPNEYSQQVQPKVLVSILEQQTATVQENQYVDNRAAAALNPILIVLNKFCRFDASFKNAVRREVFPCSLPIASGSPRRTSPADAPPDSLRAKAIALLTSPQGLVKRLAGELLWTLCGCRQSDFVRLVGLGNALPFLHVKGLVQLPASINL